ncbi:bone morphogenetic protein 1-like [Strongylocentrotus purpuratus]|uniref:CUB domain-containing protein n=1 Tax=Strongylocentrotus purpuratus TaxID=7668 RepID=A0A7M7NV00_STRPU|nr:bone morphogenetic protein 1-like [Strongylocentrotus purpuratus]
MIQRGCIVWMYGFLEDSEVANVTSPNYPNDYEINTDIRWRVIAPPGHRVMLHFVDLHIKDDLDYVTVYEGRTPIFEEAVQRIRISGFDRPPNTTSVGSYLWLQFTSDAESNDKGFNALLSYIHIRDILLTLVEEANITTPNYPNQYDNDADILWKVTAPSGYRAVLHFKNFTTQQLKDNVTVFEGRAPEFEKSVMRIHESGSTIPSNITSVGSYLWLRFISDDQSMLGTHTGFSAQLLLADIPVIDLSTTETANLTSPKFPNQYDNNTDNLWKVKAPTGYRVVVTFAYFNTENENDFVTLFEGRLPDFKESTEKRKLSGSPRLGSFTSIGSYMWLRFTSDGGNGIELLSPGFEAMLSYITIREITLENPESVAEVTSPNFPQEYNNYADILWRVKAPADYRVLLHFTALDTEPEYDVVSIYEGRVQDLEKSTRRSRNSGHGSPLNITSIGSYLWIRFTSDRNYQANGNNTYTGFRVLLSSVPVPGILLTTSETTNLTSPNFPRSYDSDTDILWKVIAPLGERVMVTFSAFNTESGYDFVTIYEGRTNDFEEAVERSKLSGSSVPDNITSIGSYVWLRFTSAGELQSCASCSGFMAMIGTVPIRGLESQSTTSPVMKTSVPNATPKTIFKEVIVIASIGSSVALLFIGFVILAVFMYHRKGSKTSKTLGPSSPDDESADIVYRNPVYGADGDSKDDIIGSSASRLPTELYQGVTPDANAADLTYCSIDDLPLLGKDMPNIYEECAEEDVLEYKSLANNATVDVVKSQGPVSCVREEAAPRMRQLTEDGYEECIVDNNKNMPTPSAETADALYDGSESGHLPTRAESPSISKASNDNGNDDQYLEVNIPGKAFGHPTSNASTASLCHEEKYNTLDFQKPGHIIRSISKSQTTLSRNASIENLTDAKEGTTYDALNIQKATSPRNPANVVIHDDNVYNTLGEF